MEQDTRRYFDYELAYNGYKKAKELFKKGGIKALIENEDFDISGGGINYIGTIEQWADEGYMPINAFAYNITIIATLKDNEWNIDGKIDVYSYNGGEDTLYINDKEHIKERINNLLDYAKDNNYTIGDYEEELTSLEKVLNILESEEV